MHMFWSCLLTLAVYLSCVNPCMFMGTLYSSLIENSKTSDLVSLAD